MKIITISIQVLIFLLLIAIPSSYARKSFGNHTLVIKKSPIEGKLLKYEYLTNSIVLVQTTERIYLSVNKGDTWSSLNEKLCRGETKCVDHYKISPVDRKRVYFRGLLAQGEGWIIPDISEDTKEFSQMEMPKDIPSGNLKHFEFHPTDSVRGLLIVQGTHEDHTTLYQTFDAGKSWKKIADHIKSAYWATPKATHYNPDRIMAIQWLHRVGGEKDGRFVTIDVGGGYVNIADRGIHHAKTLYTENNFFFVATHDKSQDVITLHVTADNGRRIRKALTPYNIPQSHYSILDTREGEVFMNIRQVRHNGKAWGHVYHSDPSGARFSSSLNYNRLSGNSVDFHRVRSLDGVFIANIVTNSDEEQCKKCEGFINCQKQCNFGTRVSFDKGTTWEPMHTTADVNSKVNCPDDSKLQNGLCPVHLHGFASKERTPIMSQHDAVGIILASGNVGSKLLFNDAISTFLSRDGGQSWEAIDVGNHIYSMTDHGGIILLADSGLTNYFRFTYDQGKTWDLFTFAEDKKYKIEHILHSDNQLAKKFILAVEDEDNVNHLLQVDFADLHKRDCNPPSSSKVGTKDSDYEYWSPKSYNNDKCLLGRQVKYVRRKSDAACFNTIPFEKPHDIKHCPCTHADYQCDYGYEESKGSDGVIHCQRDDEFVSRPPQDCTGYYNDTRGYVRIAGDTCIANAISAKLDPIEKKCLPMVSFTSVIVLISFAALIFALCLSICYNNSPTFRGCLRSLRRSSSSKSYSKVPPGSMDYSDAEDSDLGIMLAEEDEEAHVSTDENVIDETQYANSSKKKSSNITIVPKKKSSSKTIPLSVPTKSTKKGDDLYNDDDFADDDEFVKAK